MDSRPQSGLSQLLELGADLFMQATQEVVSLVPQTTAEELQQASRLAFEAFSTWRKTSILTRQATMLSLQHLIRQKIDDIAKPIVAELGKTMVDARGDVLRGLQVVEQACAIPTLMMGETLESVSADMDTFTIRQPLGVVAGICPYGYAAVALFI